MIKVLVGSNVSRKEAILSSSTTLREALEQADIDYSVGNVHLDGSTIKPGDLDKSFADFGIAEKCSLICVVKADAAATI